MDGPRAGMADALPWTGRWRSGPPTPISPAAGHGGASPAVPPDQFPAPPLPSAPQDSSAPGAQPWDMQALYTSLGSTGVATTPPNASNWFLDTGATAHMTSNAGNLVQPRPFLFSTFVTVGNGAQLPVTHTGSLAIPTSSRPLYLNNVLVTPSLVKNLISVKQFTHDNNVSVEFDPAGFSIKDP